MKGAQRRTAGELPEGAPARRRIARHLADPLYLTGYYLILGTGVSGVLGLAFWGVAALEYPPEVVGLNSAVISAVTLVSGVGTLGLSAVLVRYLPIAGRSARSLTLRSYALTFALSLVLGLAAALSSALWAPSLDFLNDGWWLAGFTVAVALTTIFTLQDAVLTGLRAAKWIPLENSLFSLAKLVLLFGFVAALPDSGPFAAWSVPLLAAVALVTLLIFRRLLPLRREAGTVDRRQMIDMAAGNYAGMLFDLAATFFLPILVANLTTPTQTAYFFIPWMTSIAIELVALSMMSSLTVEAAANLDSLRDLARRSLRHSLLLAAVLAAAMAAVGPLLLQFFGEGYADAGTTLLWLLAAGQIPNVVVVLGITIARIQHRGRTVLIVLAAQATMVIALSTVLIETMGIEGVGIAWTATQSALALVLLGTLLRPVLFEGGRGQAPGA